MPLDGPGEKKAAKQEEEEEGNSDLIFTRRAGLIEVHIVQELHFVANHLMDRANCRDTKFH